MSKLRLIKEFCFYILGNLQVYSNKPILNFIYFNPKSLNKKNNNRKEKYEK